MVARLLPNLKGTAPGSERAGGLLYHGMPGTGMQGINVDNCAHCVCAGLTNFSCTHSR
jgi:hypothetical protein